MSLAQLLKDVVNCESRVAIGGSLTAIVISFGPTHRLWGRCPHDSAC